MRNNLLLIPYTAAVFGCIFGLLTLTGCGNHCDTNAQKEAWRKYDVAIHDATKTRSGMSLQSFSDGYAKVVDAAIEQRAKDLTTCHCSLERPEMSEADVAASKANLRRMETRFLINVCTSYTSSSRCVASDGTPKYTIEKDGKIVTEHPIYIVLSREAFDSLKVKVPMPIDPNLPDSVEQPKFTTTYKKMAVSDVLARFGPYALEDDYRLFYNYDGPNFLAEIERFHNDASNWSRCGLSNKGRAQVVTICKEHDLNESDVIDALNTARVFCGE